MSSSFSKISVTSLSATSEKGRMKQFINAVQEYNKAKSDETISILSRTLQLIGVSLDINTFDPNSSVVAEFFVSLHELMSSLDSRSPLSWFGVTVLQQACRNQAAHKVLIHTYQFLPILSRLLGDHLSKDKKRKLLMLMQELTYGVVISWQISYLPHLLTILTKWIESGEEGITSLALGVLLNICHKNLPVIYTLMRTVNTKHFLKTIISMKNPVTEVQVCKLLIILEHINGEVPQEDILRFIRVTFRTIVEVFEAKDLIRLRHIVEFFLEVRAQKTRIDAVSMYDSYHDDVLRILNAVENNISQGDTHEQTELECMSLLFEFLHSLIELKIPQLNVLHGRMVELSLKWIQTETVSARALSLLCSIAVPTRNFEEQQQQEQVLEPVASGLCVLLQIIDTAVPNEGPATFTDSEQCLKLTALLQLLRVLLCNTTFRHRVVSLLKQSSILRVFDALLGSEEEAACGEPQLKDSFTNQMNEMYVHAVALVCTLANVSSAWEPILKRVFSHRQVHAVLAQTFYSESQMESKMIVFEMAKSFQFPIIEISKIMCEIQPTTTTQHPPIPAQTQNFFLQEGLYKNTPPLMTGGQIEELDRILEKMNNALSNNQIQSVATSEVMELYEYKMAAIGHAERAAQASLEAANQHSTHLQHRLAQMSTEVSRLHQLLFHAQQCDEDARRQLKISEENVIKLTARVTKEQILNKEHSQKISDQSKLIEDLQLKLQSLETKYEEQSKANSFLSKKYEDQVNKNIALVKASTAIENNMNSLNVSLEEKNSLLLKHIQEMEQLKRQVHDLEKLRQQHEETIVARDKELADTNKELENRNKILETITKLTRTK